MTEFIPKADSMDVLIPPNQQRIRSARWPVVGESAPRHDDSAWQITVAGAVDSVMIHPLDELLARPQIQRSIDVHCVTRWTKLGMRFKGIRLMELLTDSNGQPRWDRSATHLSFIARSERNHSTSLPLAMVMDADPLIAFFVDDLPLATEHGGPVRIVVPGKYFYKSVKWLERIEVLCGDRLGYWESDAGYHNEADPWLEQRYIAATISKQLAAQLIRDRDFSGRNLLSLQAAGHDLDHLNAAGALLRNADFRDAKLRGADFQGANLSNARFENADLDGANFHHADLEGADFTGADLRRADLRESSLFGTSFCRAGSDGRNSHGAEFNAETRFSPAGLQSLTPDQYDYVVGNWTGH